MLIVLIAKKDSDSGFGLTILKYSRIVYYSELPIASNIPQFFDYYFNSLIVNAPYHSWVHITFPCCAWFMSVCLFIF